MFVALDVETLTDVDPGLDFMAAKRQADEIADARLDQPVCLSGYDLAADRESPAHASECHGDCEIPGYVEYAMTRGAELKVIIGDGAYVFCYRPLGEFAET